MAPLLMLLGYVLVLETVGFPIATVGLLTLLFKSLGQATWRGSILIAALMTATVFSLFSLVLDIPLPLGTVFTDTLGWFES